MEDSTRPSTHQGRSSKSGGGGAKGNRFVVSDFTKLLRWRRGLGLLDDAMMLAMLDIVIPRHAQLKTTLPLDKALGQWVADNVPEIEEAHGAEWVEARRVEIMSREHGSFPTIDEIAEHLHITQDEVDGACLCSLRAFDNPKRERTRHNRMRNAQRKRECRAQNNAKPQSESVAKAKPWEALGMSRRTFYRKGLNKASSGDQEPIQRGTISSDTDTLAPVRQIQYVSPKTDAHDNGRDAIGEGGSQSRKRSQAEARDVSEDLRAFTKARWLLETVELPY